MKLISEIIKSKLVEEKENYGWNTYTHHLLADLIKLCNELKTAEINNIDAAVRYGTNIPNHMFLDMEVYDHIKFRYEEESMTAEELDKCKKSIDFWQKYLEHSNEDKELQDCNCGEADKCNCHIAEGGNNA